MILNCGGDPEFILTPDVFIREDSDIAHQLLLDEIDVRKLVILVQKQVLFKSVKIRPKTLK